MDTVTEFILHQYHGVRNLHYDDSLELIIGSQTYSELVHSENINSIMSYNYSANINTDQGPMVLGMKVTILPWMVGAIVIPTDRKY
jgi:hypothetical protein